MVALVTVLAGIQMAAAEPVDENLWITNGVVHAVAREGGTIYIGGDFTHVGPATGGGLPLDASTGAPPPSFPKVAGAVRAVVADGSGGWYIGGTFTHVGGVPRSNVAHVAADLSVSAWNPDADKSVFALAVSGSTVYVGGSFTRIGGGLHSCIAALDATTGAARTWNPNVDDPYVRFHYVSTLAASGSTVYVGGEFWSISGQWRHNLAAIDATSGTLTAWDPTAADGVLSVDAIAVIDSTVYVGGYFWRMGGQDRNNIAAIDAATGAATGWNPNADDWVYSLAVNGSTVYAGGDFSKIGGKWLSYMAALDAATGTAAAWSPNPDGDVLAIALNDATIYTAGDFTNIGGQARNHVAALAAASGAALAWDPNADHPVYALAIQGSTVYAGGLFTSIARQARNNIAALDVAAGGATSWNPDANDSVYALAVALARTGPAALAVYDVRGRLVRRLADGTLGAGEHVLRWDGRDDTGREVAGGLYICRLEVLGAAQVQKVVLLRDN